MRAYYIIPLVCRIYCVLSAKRKETRKILNNPAPQNYVMLSPEQVAQRLNVSKSWVYQHIHDLGGIKLHGLVRFREGIIDELVENKEGLDVSIYMARGQVQQERVQNQGRGQESPRKTKVRSPGGQDANRHGLFGSGKFIPRLEQAETC